MRRVRRAPPFGISPREARPKTKDRNTMTCTDCRPLIVDYVHHQLDDVTDAAVFTPLHECAACMQAHREELALVEALRAAFTPERAMPTSVVAGVRMAMHADEQPSLVMR